MTVGRFKFVLWAPDADLMFKCLRELYDKYEWSFYFCGLEHCPTTGRQHIDGYYEYPTQRRWATENKKWKKKFGTGYGDLQLASGTAAENCDYSEKDGGRSETQGTASQGQGFRTDLLGLKDGICSGKRTVEEVCLEDPLTFHQYGRTLQKIEDIALRKQFRNWMTTCDWYYGPTETVKSARAFASYDPSTHYVWKNDKGWQDGYIGQPTIIINDFRAEIKYNELLQMIDRYPHFVPRRSREPAPFLAKHVIITSSLSPEQLYHNRSDEDKIEQLLRRIKVIWTGPDFLDPHFKGMVSVNEQFDCKVLAP